MDFGYNVLGSWKRDGEGTIVCKLSIVRIGQWRDKVQQQYMIRNILLIAVKIWSLTNRLPPPSSSQQPLSLSQALSLSPTLSPSLPPFLLPGYKRASHMACSQGAVWHRNTYRRKNSNTLLDLYGWLCFKIRWLTRKWEPWSHTCRHQTDTTAWTF